MSLLWFVVVCFTIENSPLDDKIITKAEKELFREVGEQIEQEKVNNRYPQWRKLNLEQYLHIHFKIQLPAGSLYFSFFSLQTLILKQKYVKLRPLVLHHLDSKPTCIRHTLRHFILTFSNVDFFSFKPFTSCKDGFVLAILLKLDMGYGFMTH